MAEARALRAAVDLPDLDPELEASVGEEMAAALAAATDLVEAPAPPVAERAAERTLTMAGPMLAQWQKFRPLFAEAMEGTNHSLGALEADVAAGRAYFWPGANCALVTEVMVYPDGARDMRTLWAVGDVDEVLGLEPAVASAARLLGCAGVLVEGRKGWEKLLRPLGYKPWSTTVRKEL